jgi:hypothetical protein
MVPRREFGRCLEEIKQVPPKLGDELWTSIADDIFWKTMVLKHLPHK